MKTTLPDKWLVIGASSLTGSRFLELVDGDVSSVDSPFDITDLTQVKSALEKFSGKYVINFAGITNVDEIEKSKPNNPNDQNELEQNLAYRVNVIGTKNLIKVCLELKKFPVFISTGFVFDGKNGPYSETDPIASIEDVGFYAWTKILAEKAIQDSGIDSLTIRISYPYRAEFLGKLDFARSMLKVYDEFKSGKRESIYPMFSDQTLTPTFIDDLPSAVLTLINQNSTGIYHVASPEITSPYDFCLELLRVARNVENPEEIIKKGSAEEFQQSHPELSKRPIKGGEKCDKIISLGFTPTSWKEGIKKAFGS